jgi:aminoglycoside phosphotransferase (APT) family kinase protein
MDDNIKSDPHALDLAALGDELEHAIPHFGALKSAVKFKGGQSNPTYLLTSDSGRYVLRAKPPGALLKSAHQVDREFRIMKALKGSGVPVPDMLYLSEEASSIGRMFFVMSHVDGRIFWDPALPDETADIRRDIYGRMNAVLATLHSLDPEAIGLGDYGRPGNYFARQIDRWTKQYHASETVKLEDMDWLISWLETHQPEDDGAVSLVHGDFRLDNFMFAKSGSDILAVLDWELSTLGHPTADLAYQCMQWRLPYESGFRGIGGLDRAALGLPDEADYVKAYCRRRGISGVDHWVFCLAFSFFRLAAIIQGVVKRAEDGNASDPERAKQIAMAVPLLARMARDLINKGE